MKNILTIIIALITINSYSQSFASKSKSNNQKTSLDFTYSTKNKIEITTYYNTKRFVNSNNNYGFIIKYPINNRWKISVLTELPNDNKYCVSLKCYYKIFK